MNPFKKLTDKLASLRETRPEVGSVAEDGSIYIGKVKGQYWFAAAEDAQGPNGKRLRMDFNSAASYAKNLDVHGHNDWVLPNEKTLIKMRENQNAGAFKGTYAPKGSWPYSQYWTSQDYPDRSGPLVETKRRGFVTTTTTYNIHQPPSALTVNFNTRCMSTMEYGTDCTFSVRAVRSVPKLPKQGA